MRTIFVSLIFYFDSPPFSSQEELENRYQNIWVPFATFLFKHPNNRAAVYIPGRTLLWLEEKHSEFTKLFEKMVSRSQVEILGGAFYEGILPLIFSIDRNGQIEKLNFEIRRIFGKRPRGCVLFGSIWENSLVYTMQNCGFEYVILDSSVSKASAENPFRPCVSSDKGKTIKLLFCDSSIYPKEKIEAKTFLSSILEKSKSGICAIKIQSGDLKKLLDSLFLEHFYFILRNLFSMEMTDSIPREAILKSGVFSQIHIASSISASLTKSASIFDYLFENPRKKSLYDRMLKLSLLLSLCRGDKGRKSLARELLWQAQAGFFYFTKDENVEQKSWKLLSEAEKTVREAGGFSPMSASYDYNGDGFSEYIFSMERFSAGVSLDGARIFEFCTIGKGVFSSGNYASHSGGLFAARILSQSELCELENGRNSSAPLERYSETSFSASKNELRLKADLGERVSIEKKFLATNESFTVQVILRSESREPISKHFALECSFSPSQWSFEAISNGNYISGGASFKKISGMSNFHLVDKVPGISFIFEPNEHCDCFVFSDESGGLKIIFCWKIEIPQGKEIEKAVSMAVV